MRKAHLRRYGVPRPPCHVTRETIGPTNFVCGAQTWPRTPLREYASRAVIGRRLTRSRTLLIAPAGFLRRAAPSCAEAQLEDACGHQRSSSARSREPSTVMTADDVSGSHRVTTAPPLKPRHQPARVDHQQVPMAMSTAASPTLKRRNQEETEAHAPKRHRAQQDHQRRRARNDAARDPEREAAPGARPSGRREGDGGVRGHGHVLACPSPCP